VVLKSFVAVAGLDPVNQGVRRIRSRLLGPNGVLERISSDRTTARSKLHRSRTRNVIDVAVRPRFGSSIARSAIQRDRFSTASVLATSGAAFFVYLNPRAASDTHPDRRRA